MNSVVAFPNDSIGRTVSPARLETIARLIEAVDQCALHMGIHDREAPFYEKLRRTCDSITRDGVTIACFGRLVAGCENWLKNYRVIGDRPPHHTQLLNAQRHLRMLCDEMPFTSLATQSDLVAYAREISLGATRIVS